MKLEHSPTFLILPTSWLRTSYFLLLTSYFNTSYSRFDFQFLTSDFWRLSSESEVRVKKLQVRSRKWEGMKLEVVKNLDIEVGCCEMVFENIYDNDRRRWWMMEALLYYKLICEPLAQAN